MNTDTYFRIGSTHKICQDFALSNDRNRKTGVIVGDPFIIVSDGCSTAEHSDIGARLLALAAKRHIDMAIGDDSFVCATKAMAEVSCRTLGLSRDALSATLLVGKATDVGIYGLIYGDGVIAARNRDGSLHFEEVRFVSGAPYYLRYELNPLDKANYIEKFGLKVELNRYKVDAKGVEKNTTSFDLDPARPFFSYAYDIEHWKTVALFSDGVSAFEKTVKTGTSISKDHVDLEIIIPELMAFKNFAGEFLQRRSIRAFENFTSADIQGTDDVGIGVISTD